MIVSEISASVIQRQRWRRLLAFALGAVLPVARALAISQQRRTMPPRSKRRGRSSVSLASPSTSPDASATPTPSGSPAASPDREQYSPVAPRPLLKDDSSTRAAKILATALIDWAIVEVACEAHHAQYLRSPNCPLVSRSVAGARDGSVGDGGTSSEMGGGSASAALVVTGGSGVAAVGKAQVDASQETEASSGVLHSDKNVNVECSNCSSSTAASRYAQHLEKCLGRGGRTSSRAASARLKASAEKAEKEAAADMSEDVIPRKRHPGTSAVNAKTEETIVGDLPPLPQPPRHRAS